MVDFKKFIGDQMENSEEMKNEIENEFEEKYGMSLDEVEKKVQEDQNQAENTGFGQRSEWGKRFKEASYAKSKKTPNIPPKLSLRLNKMYDLEIVEPPYNPIVEGKPLTIKRTTKEGVIDDQVWVMLVKDDLMVKTFYPPGFLLYQLEAFREEHDLSEDQLKGRKILIQREEDPRDEKLAKKRDKYSIIIK